MKSLFDLTSRRWWMLFVAGFCFGPIGDLFHIYTNTAAYPQDRYFFYLGKLPLWVPVEFALAVVLIGHIIPWVERRLDHQLRAISFTKVVSANCLFILQYMATSFLSAPSLLHNLIFYLGAFFMWRYYDGRVLGLMLAVATMLAGTLVELTIIQMGHFSYDQRLCNLMGLAPSWLPALYFSAGISVGLLGSYLAQQDLLREE